MTTTMDKKPASVTESVKLELKPARSPQKQSKAIASLTIDEDPAIAGYEGVRGSSIHLNPKVFKLGQTQVCVSLSAYTAKGSDTSQVSVSFLHVQGNESGYSAEFRKVPGSQIPVQALPELIKHLQALQAAWEKQS